MIKIKTEKCLVRGEKCRKVIDIECLSGENLPKQYTSGRGPGNEYIWKDGRDLYSNTTGYHAEFFLGKEATYPQAEFDQKLEFIRKCGDRLREINSQLAKENAGWEGVETFVI